MEPRGHHCSLGNEVLSRFGQELAKRSPVSMVESKIAHVAGIAAELLVGSFADLDHLHSAVMCELGNKIKRDANPVRNWLILMVDHLFQIIDHVAFLDEDLMVIRLEPICDRFRMLEFVQMRVIAEADSECLHRMW